MYPSATVSFVGGPYDGYEHCVEPGEQCLHEALDLPISANIIRVLGGEDPGARRAPRSVAVYRLIVRDGECHYAFGGTRLAGRREAREMNEWCREMFRAWGRSQNSDCEE